MQGANVANSPLLRHQHKWPASFISDRFRALQLKVQGHASARRDNPKLRAVLTGSADVACILLKWNTFPLLRVVSGISGETSTQPSVDHAWCITNVRSTAECCHRWSADNAVLSRIGKVQSCVW